MGATKPSALTVVCICIDAEDALTQGMARAFNFGWCAELVAGQLALERGRLHPTGVPGHGVEIRDEVRSSEDLEGRASRLRG